VASTRHPDEPPGFTEVLIAWSWWDAPRNGVVRIDGSPHRFRCDFDEALDDYPDEYRVWPITEAELTADLALWATWVDWRRRFDRGENPQPLEKDASWQSLLADARRHAEPAPTVVRVAIPEWRLDPDRSFAVRTPRHLVRFVYVDKRGTDAL
jgi:hypothetical protein